MKTKNSASGMALIWTPLVLLRGGAIICVLSLSGGNNKSVPPRIFAQKIVDDTLAAHPEIEGLELSTTPPNKNGCVTIASNDLKEISEKCDKEDLDPQSPRLNSS